MKKILSLVLALAMLIPCFALAEAPKTLTEIADALVIYNAEGARGNITLLDTFEGASIEWKSSNPDVITDKLIDGKPAGVVTRGAADQQVTMTATLTLGGESVTKEIVVNVLAAPAPVSEDDYVGYLFGHFIGEGSADGEQIYFATSPDGRFYTDLNEGQPVIISTVGELGLRDPYMLRSAEGDRFFIVATDLSIFHRGGWRKNEQGYYDPSTTGSHYLVVYESTDLVNWSEPKHIKVAPENAGMAWAPEMIYNDLTGEYLIFFASSIMDPATKYKAKPNAIYYVATRDFVNFSETKLLIDNQTDNIGEGKPREIIDSTIIKIGDYFYSASKDGDNAELNGGIRVMRTLDLTDPTGWEKVYDLDELGLDLTGLRVSVLSNASLEGPEFFRYNKKDWADPAVPEYGLFADQYAAGAGYLPIITTNVMDVDNSEGSWKILQPGEYSFDMLKKRHGTIVNLTAEEMERVNAAFPNGEQFLKDKVATIALNGISLSWRVTENLTLPTEIDGVKLTWESANPAAITNEGVITRGTENVRVALTVTGVTEEGGSATRTINLFVMKAE